MKKIFSMLLAIMMVMSLATTAFATGDLTNETGGTAGGGAVQQPTTTLKINTSGYTARTFDAYMVMAATNDGDKFSYSIVDDYRNILVTVTGAAIKDTEGDDLTQRQIDDNILAIIATYTGEQTRHFADALYRAIKATDPAIVPDVTGWDGSSKTVAQGYWLIADVTDLSGKSEANSVTMLDSAGDAETTVNLKPDVTDMEKKVDDEKDSLVDPIADNEDSDAWWDTADYDIGDEVPFRIDGQMANDVASYSYYSFRIADTLSDGLDFVENSIALQVNGTAVEIKAATSDATAPWVYSISGRTLNVYPNYGYTKNDGTQVAASATTGGDFLKTFPEGTSHDNINSSTYRLTYKAKLNSNAVFKNTNEAKVIYSNNPYTDSLGETPKDTTITFTYKFIVNKVDTNNEPLTGATFALYKFVAEGAREYPSDDSTYTETVYETAEEAALNNGYFNHPAANCYGKFSLVNRLTLNDAKTTFTFNGIDDGYYLLLETKAPDGYNAIEPVEFHVKAAHVTDLTSVASGSELTSLTAVVKGGSAQTISGNAATGELTATIENKSGTELPSTGGMGTTVIYMVGAAMVLFALVMLVTKKRMIAED